MLSSMAGGGQAGELVLWDAPSGASFLLPFSRALQGRLSGGLHGFGSCSVPGHLQTCCAFLMSLLDWPGFLLFERDQECLRIS